MKTNHHWVALLALNLVLLTACSRCGKKQTELIQISGAIPFNAVVADLEPEGLPLVAYLDADVGTIWIDPDLTEVIAEDYNAEALPPREDIQEWSIDIFGRTQIFQVQDIAMLNRQQPVAAQASGVLQGVNCTDNVEKGIPVGACINMFDVKTGAFAFSWNIPAGGLSWCGDPGGRCRWTIVTTGTNPTFTGRNCTGGAAGVRSVRVCEADTF